MTLTPIAERLALELSLPVFMTYVFVAWIRTPDLPLAVSIVKPNNLHTSPIKGTVQSYTSAFSYLCIPGRTRLHGKRAFFV